MKSAGKARSNGLYRHIRTSKEIIRNLLNDLWVKIKAQLLSIQSRSCALLLVCVSNHHIPSARLLLSDTFCKGMDFLSKNVIIGEITV